MRFRRIFARTYRAVLEHCSEEEKLALAEAAFGGGILDPEAFWGKYGVQLPRAEDHTTDTGKRHLPSICSWRVTTSACSTWRMRSRSGFAACFLSRQRRRSR